MTYLEKYREVHPDDRRSDFLIAIKECPNLTFDGVPCYSELYGHGSFDTICVNCWNQEYQGEEII